MIPRITRGGSAYGALSYDHGPGRADEHHNPHKVAGNVAGRTWKQRSAAIDAHVQRMHPKLSNPIIRTSLRIAPEDRRLTDREWREVASEYVEKMGFSNAPWEAVRHADDHIHLTMSRVNWDGSVVDQWKDKTKAQAAVRDIERHHQLVDASKRYNRDTPQVSRNDRERAERISAATGRNADPERTTLRERIDAAEKASNGTRADFEAKLAEHGVQARANISKPTDRNPDGRMNGYSYRLDGHTDSAGEPVWFKGSKLGRRYGWAHTERRLDDQRARRSETVTGLDTENANRPAPVDEQTTRPTVPVDSRPVGTVAPLDAKKERGERDRADTAESRRPSDSGDGEHDSKGRPNVADNGNTTNRQGITEDSADNRREQDSSTRQGHAIDRAPSVEDKRSRPDDQQQQRSTQDDRAAQHQQRDADPDDASHDRDDSTHADTPRRGTEPEIGRRQDNPVTEQNQKSDRARQPDDRSTDDRERHARPDVAETTRLGDQDRSRTQAVGAHTDRHRSPRETTQSHETRQETPDRPAAPTPEVERHSPSSDRDRAQQRAEQWRRDRAGRRNQLPDRHDQPQHKPDRSEQRGDVGGTRDDTRVSRDSTPRSQPSPDRPERSTGKDTMSTPDKSGRDPDSAAAKQRSRDRAQQWAQDRKERTQDRDRDRDKGRDR